MTIDNVDAKSPRKPERFNPFKTVDSIARTNVSTSIAEAYREMLNPTFNPSNAKLQNNWDKVTGSSSVNETTRVGAKKIKRLLDYTRANDSYERPTETSSLDFVDENVKNLLLDLFSSDPRITAQPQDERLQQIFYNLASDLHGEWEVKPNLRSDPSSYNKSGRVFRMELHFTREPLAKAIEFFLIEPRFLPDVPDQEPGEFDFAMPIRIPPQPPSGSEPTMTPVEVGEPFSLGPMSLLCKNKYLEPYHYSNLSHHEASLERSIAFSRLIIVGNEFEEQLRQLTAGFAKIGLLGNRVDRNLLNFRLFDRMVGPRTIDFLLDLACMRVEFTEQMKSPQIMRAAIRNELKLVGEEFGLIPPEQTNEASANQSYSEAVRRPLQETFSFLLENNVRLTPKSVPNSTQ